MKTKIDFWKLKHQIDDEVKRLGWDTNRCVEYIKEHYGKRSRLVMTDFELTGLLVKLRNTRVKDNVSKVNIKRNKRRRR
jgi:hypothetical protein